MSNRFHNLTGIGIEDNLTGRIYKNRQDITNLLNQINEKADQNAEQYWKLRELILDSKDLDELQDRLYKEIAR
jgi:hypothetical protein